MDHVEKDTDDFKRFESEILGRIFGLSNNFWNTATIWHLANYMNHDLHALIKHENIVKFINSHIIQWLGYIYRMG